MNGCTDYEWGWLAIPFPTGEINCWGCPLLDTDISKRHFCRRTGEYLSAPKERVGMICPIRFEERENNDE